MFLMLYSSGIEVSAGHFALVVLLSLSIGSDREKGRLEDVSYSRES